jgi:hypothetical protein
MTLATSLVLCACLPRGTDPTAGLASTKAQMRRLSCQRLAQAEAHQRFPSEVPENAVRELATGETDALVCENDVMSAGDRSSRDEGILRSLTASTSALTELASASVTAPVTWYVDTLYPNQRVASKVSVAARVELAERGRAVSDRVPLLAAGDLEVLSHLSLHQAFVLACTRAFAEKSLTERDVLLAFSIVDVRDTSLHAGLCQQGSWRWLQ